MTLLKKTYAWKRVQALGGTLKNNDWNGQHLVGFYSNWGKLPLACDPSFETRKLQEAAEAVVPEWKKAVLAEHAQAKAALEARRAALAA